MMITIMSNEGLSETGGEPNKINNWDYFQINILID